MTTLNSQVTGVISWIIYGIFILLAIAVLIILAFAVYKFVMWVLYAGSTEDKKKKPAHPIKVAIEKETEYGKDLKEITEVV